MKYHKIDSWKYDDSMECMLLFASLIDEMTFNYTVDSYKAPAMNTLSLLEELYYTINDVEGGLIADGAVNSIIEEVRESIEEDKVFQDLLSDRGISYVQDLLKTESKRDIKVAIELLSSLEALNIDYIISLRYQLATLIKQNKKKKEIERLARTFVTQLRYLGYSNEFLYHHNLRYFFSRDAQITSVNDIDEYLLRFDYKERTYKLVILADSHFRMMKSHLKRMGDNVHNNYDFDASHEKIYRFYKEKTKEINGCFVVLNVKALDFYQARQVAYGRLDRLCVLFSFYHHKSNMSVSDDCVAIDMDCNEYCYLRSPVRNITKCNDMRPREANKRFKLIADKLNIESESMSRLLKAVWLHRQAVTAYSEDNQFVNLFTAIEVLMPKDTQAKKDRIRQIADVIIPILCLSYYRKLVAALGNALYSWKPSLVQMIVDDVSEGTDWVDKIGAMLCLEKYDELRNKMYSILTDEKYFLARHRIYRLNEILKDPNSVRLFMQRHENRLRWHIDRLYRTRNMIVHSGETVENLGSLLENLHFYFDVMVNAIFEDNIQKGFMKLEFTFTSAVVRYRQYKHLLEKARNFDESNYLELIFAR